MVHGSNEQSHVMGSTGHELQHQLSLEIHGLMQGCFHLPKTSTQIHNSAEALG